MDIRFQPRNVNSSIIKYQDYVLFDPPSDLFDVVISSHQDQTVMTYQDALPILESEYFQNHSEIIIEGYNMGKKDLIDTEETRQSYFINSNR